ncbi:MAG: hypothetical protein WCO52_06015 [bacterium]
MARCKKMADGGPAKPDPKPNPMSDQDTPPKGTVPSAPTGAGKEWRERKKFASGGSVRGSGCESKGKTRGKFV